MPAEEPAPKKTKRSHHTKEKKALQEHKRSDHEVTVEVINIVTISSVFIGYPFRNIFLIKKISLLILEIFFSF